MAQIKLAFRSRPFSRPDHVHRGELRRSFVVATDPLLSIGFVHSRLTEAIPDDSSCLLLSLSDTGQSPCNHGSSPLLSSPAGNHHPRPPSSIAFFCSHNCATLYSVPPSLPNLSSLWPELYIAAPPPKLDGPASF